MARSLDEYVNDQLSRLPIREMKNAGDRERLIRSVVDGEVRPVTLEKTFVPANEISRYVVVEHLVGQPGSEQRSHTHNELSRHVLYGDAMRSFQEKVYNNHGEGQSGSELRELLLVGKYGQGQLVYDKDGELDKTSGISLDYALTFPGRSYNLSSGRDPFCAVTIQQKLFVLFDTKTETVQLLDAALNKVLLVDFWKQKEGAAINGKKIEPKSIEDIDLLPKNVMSQGNGIKR